MDTGRNKQIPPAEVHSAGRVVIDSRGRNVWQWNDNQLDSTSIMLKRLENSELAIEPTRRLRRPAGAARAKDSTSDAGRCKGDGTLGELKIEQTFSVKLGGGFDPYNRS